MDALSSSLLSPAIAPIALAEERSALSQQYSDTISNDPDLSKHVVADQSSLQPCASPIVDTQEGHSLTEESSYIESLVTDLKYLCAPVWG